jgi:hypothetical protein
MSEKYFLTLNLTVFCPEKFFLASFFECPEKMDRKNIDKNFFLLQSIIGFAGQFYQTPPPQAKGASYAPNSNATL